MDWIRGKGGWIRKIREWISKELDHEEYGLALERGLLEK